LEEIEVTDTMAGGVAWDTIKEKLLDANRHLCKVKAEARREEEERTGVKVGYNQLTPTEKSTFEGKVTFGWKKEDAMADILATRDWLSAHSDLLDEVLHLLFNPQQFNLQQIMDSQLTEAVTEIARMVASSRSNTSAFVNLALGKKRCDVEAERGQARTPEEVVFQEREALQRLCGVIGLDMMDAETRAQVLDTLKRQGEQIDAVQAAQKHDANEFRARLDGKKRVED
jgi:hypothetical protein